MQFIELVGSEYRLQSMTSIQIILRLLIKSADFSIEFSFFFFLGAVIVNNLRRVSLRY